MTLSSLSFMQKTGPASSLTESRPFTDAGASTLPGAFAERLQQQLKAPPPEPPRPAPERSPSNQEPAPEEPDAAARQARKGSAPPQRPRASTPPAPRSPETPPADRAAAGSAGDPQARAAQTSDGETDATDDVAAPGARRGRSADASADGATPVNWMLQWMAVQPQTDSAGAGPLLPRGGGTDTALARAGKGLGHGGTGRLVPDELPGGPAAKTDPAAGGSGAWQAALEAESVGAGQAAATQEHSLAAVLGTPSVGAWAELAAPGAPADAPPSTQVNLNTPVDRPEFRDELAAQISSFAHDGIQEAVLNLNPAEMGPISVQIVLDGTQATVDFQALQPATRELIEASLPALASALHGEGLTLSGGSVGDQRAPSQDGEPGRGRREERATDEVTGVVSAPPVAAQRARGGLDLYA